jgi:hypothetical protein
MTLPKPAKRGPKPRKRIARGRPVNPRSQKARRKAWRDAVNLARKLARLRDGRCLPAPHVFPCGGPLNGCHIFGVGAYPAVALDELNILSACGGWHRWSHHHPIEAETFARDWIGDEAYADLKRRAVQTGVKPDPFQYLEDHKP